MDWYRTAEQELAESAALIQSQRPLRMDRLEALAGGLVSSLKQSDELVVHALSGPSGSPLVTNLINVGILGAKLGIGLGYYGKELERLALAGLVHDVGLFAVPQSLVAKSGRLTPEERTIIERHPELGAQLFQRMGVEYHWLAQLVRQVHERVNGKGYPNRLQGAQISEMAKILGVVDIVDALVSDRPYRRRMVPHEAIKELLVVERTAFPREILKVLVEQLTVYPIGTTVRLTTGELATVYRVNNRYPLRPVVEVPGAGPGSGSDPRQIDLSLTPLISILDTVNPPVPGRVPFADLPAKREVPSSPGSEGEQFTALLESLDAIVSAIQGVVETRMGTDRGGETSQQGVSRAGSAQGAVPSQGDHTFQKEIAGLFALEAREWLSQIQTALTKLGTGAEGAGRSKLYGFILNGISNLARSASTVQMSEIEAMATNLLPILRDVGRAEARWTAETLRPLHEGLERISDAVHRLAGESAGPGVHDKTNGKDEVLCEEADARSDLPASVSPPLPKATEEPRAPEGMGASMPLLRALRELRQIRARSAQPERDVLEAVIARAQQEVGEQQEQISAEVIERILRDLGKLDEEFLREVHERVPQVTSRISQLRERGPADGLAASQLDAILRHIDALQRSAKTIDAPTIIMFLQGVTSFLTAATQRKAEMVPQRLRAVEERIQTLIPMAEQWVTLGRLERASIEEILPR